MGSPAYAIPEKLFFKIGEVCDLVGIQAHVLRYWESEFPMLAPQKNPAGQRTYRKRDVEMVMRIKELLYDEQYTIAGAKKKLQSEMRGVSKLRVVTPNETPRPVAVEAIAPKMIEDLDFHPASLNDTQVRAIRELAKQLQELLLLLDQDIPEPQPARRR
jgi:DNA-binding transcriptional MerR regulator